MQAGILNNANVHLKAFRTLSILQVQDENKYCWKTSLLRIQIK
jgi:hypothetical protein